MILLANKGISDEIRQVFVIYLASHDRPMSELLNPPRHELIQNFQANGELFRKYTTKDYAGRRPSQTFRIPPLLRGK
jgi:hypothetical protein